MFVLFGIDTRTRQPERVTQGDSWHALRRMWQAYPSAAIGDLEGSADDVEVKPGTDRTHVVALTRAIVRAQRAHRRDESAADAEPAEDRDAKPANVSQPAPPAPIAEPTQPASVAEPAKLPPLHRHANDNVPCPVADCSDASAAYTATLPMELRALCKRHRDNAQANRSKGMTVADALETVLASGRARLARANAAATKPPVVEAPAVDPPAVDPRMVADAPGPQVELTDERVEQLTARLRTVVDEAADAGGQVLHLVTEGERSNADPLAPIFDRLDAVANAATAPSDALTRADFAAVLRELRGTLRVAFDVAIARLESPR